MNLAGQLLERIAEATNPNERARLRCQLAKELQDAGDYEGARSAMGELWQRIGERPRLEGLDEAARAEVLLRAGALTGWIGSAKQFEGAQDKAKDLITEAMTLFGAVDDAEKLDECQLEIALCHWRQGAFDDARDMLHRVLDRLADSESESKLVAVVRSAINERSAMRYHDALRIQTEYAPLFGENVSHALRAKFHNEFGIVLDILGTSERREDYIDRALLEYTAASYHFEQAGHLRYCACVENNLAMLYLAVGRFKEAHEHLDRARPIFVRLKDEVHTAQLDETRSKVLLAEGRNAEAERTAGAAVRTLEKGGEQSLLAEALTAHGTALARTGRHVRARLTLQRAVVIAERAGDTETAGRALLAVVEELYEQTPRGELFTLYEQAAEHLANSQQPNMAARLVSDALLVLRVLKPQTPEDVPADWQGFSLREAVRRYEGMIIERALKDAGGVVTRAAQLLGLKHYQTLISLLNSRHRELLRDRTPILPRRRSIVKKPDE